MSRRTAIISFLLLVIVSTGTFIFPAFAQPEFKRVTAILSSNAAPYREHLEGFTSRFEDEVTVVELNSNTTSLAASIGENPPDLILAVGTSAAKFAMQFSNSTPVLFTMVYSPERHGLAGHDNVAGISLRVPPKETLEALDTVKPRSLESLRVGMIYSRPPEDLDSLKSALSKDGHALDAREVVSHKESVRELKSLLPVIDVLWLAADPVVLPDSESLKYVLRRALDEGVAVVGLSDAHVRIGALASVSVDYRLEGETAARLAGWILDGEQPMAIGILEPQSTVWSLNEKVSREIGWPVLRAARKQFERVHP